MPGSGLGRSSGLSLPLRLFIFAFLSLVSPATALATLIEGRFASRLGWVLLARRGFRARSRARLGRRSRGCSCSRSRSCRRCSGRSGSCGSRRGVGACRRVGCHARGSVEGGDGVGRSAVYNVMSIGPRKPELVRRWRATYSERREDAEVASVAAPSPPSDEVELRLAESEEVESNRPLL